MVTGHVNKVLLEDAEHGESRATGVLFEHRDKIHTVYAKRDVILSAG